MMISPPLVFTMPQKEEKGGFFQENTAVNRKMKYSDFGKIDYSDFGNIPSSKNRNNSPVTVL